MKLFFSSYDVTTHTLFIFLSYTWLSWNVSLHVTLVPSQWQLFSYFRSFSIKDLLLLPAVSSSRGGENGVNTDANGANGAGGVEECGEEGFGGVGSGGSNEVVTPVMTHTIKLPMRQQILGFWGISPQTVFWFVWFFFFWSLCLSIPSLFLSLFRLSHTGFPHTLFPLSQFLSQQHIPSVFSSLLNQTQYSKFMACWWLDENWWWHDLAGKRPFYWGSYFYNLSNHIHRNSSSCQCGLTSLKLKQLKQGGFLWFVFTVVSHCCRRNEKLNYFSPSPLC